MNTINQSKVVARAAVHMAISENRETEHQLKKTYAEEGIKTAAIDIGGDFLKSMNKMVEQAIVAARREGLIEENSPREDGSIAGALHDALSQVASKASGMSVGGKIGLARCHEHISVSVFLSIGLLYLDDVALGLAHRLI
ncbi:MAG: HutP family protein [Peptococcaceae bacterium]|nr:HutP family protein [Peptococcaceae bacterium]